MKGEHSRTAIIPTEKQEESIRERKTTCRSQNSLKKCVEIESVHQCKCRLDTYKVQYVLRDSLPCSMQNDKCTLKPDTRHSLWEYCTSVRPHILLINAGVYTQIIYTHVAKQYRTLSVHTLVNMLQSIHLSHMHYKSTQQYTCLSYFNLPVTLAYIRTHTLAPQMHKCLLSCCIWASSSR